MTTFRERFREIGLAWPNAVRPNLPFAPAVRIGNIVYVSGQIPEIGDEIAFSGKVGGAVGIAAAIEAAALCAANILFWLDKELDGDLDRLVGVAKVTVYINAAPGFGDFSEVGNGASELLLKVLGTRGQHARVAVGMAGLPVNVPVEVDAIIHIR